MIALLIEIAVLYFRVWLAYIEAAVRFIAPFLLPVKDIKDEVVLITGSGHGIGKEMAILFAKFGAKVVMWDVNKFSNEKVANDIAKCGGKTYPYTCDVTDPDQVKQVATDVRREVGNVTILVNNAGVLNAKRLTKLSVEQIKTCINVNVMSHFWTLKEFLPDMMEMNRGHVVCISSVAGIFGVMNATDYSASKFAVRGLMKAVHEELQFYNDDNKIQTTTVFPHFVDTGMTKRIMNRFPNLIPISKPEKTAQLIVDGVLRNARNIYVPRIEVGFLAAVAGLLPERALSLVMQFTGSYVGEV